MGRELQKKKNKSGLHKVHRKPKKTQKPLLANPIIAAHWDRDQTLSQNYRRLGLTSKINGATGGTEQRNPLNPTTPSTNHSRFAIKHTPQGSATQEARIERDHSTGAILHVIEDASLAAARVGPYKALQDPLEELDAIVMADVEAVKRDYEQRKEGENTESIVGALEEQAARPAGRDQRKQSAREVEFLGRLVERYGVDEEQGCFERMARDGEINIMQQSAGDLRKRIRRYLKERGEV